MSKKCIICNKKKGKRGCGIYDKQLICPLCCGENRGARCESSRYFQESTRYKAAKKESIGHKHFTIELNEEIDNAVDKAMMAVESKKYAAAEKILKPLIKAHPKHQMVLYGMGVFHAMQGQNDRAIEYFKHAVDVFPLFTEAYYNLAIAYKNDFDIANMIRTLRKVTGLDQIGGELYNNARDLIQSTENMMRENGGAGLENFINGQDEFDHAFKLMEEGNWQSAIKGFERAVRWNPALPQPYGNMGICYAKMGKTEDQTTDFLILRIIRQISVHFHASNRFRL